MSTKACDTCAHWLSDEPSCSDPCERCDDSFYEWVEGDAERAVVVAAQIFAAVYRNATNSDHARDVLLAAVDALDVSP